MIHCLQFCFNFAFNFNLRHYTVATALLKVGGDDAIGALRAVSICSGLPYTVALCCLCTSLWRALKIDQAGWCKLNPLTPTLLPLLVTPIKGLIKQLISRVPHSN
jgi:choline-glycine betaine transporter